MNDSAADRPARRRPAGIAFLTALLLGTAPLTLAPPAQAQPIQLGQPQPVEPTQPTQDQPTQDQPGAAQPMPDAGPRPLAPGGAPMRLIPFGQPQQDQQPQPQAAAPGGFQVEELGTLSADTGGTLHPAAGGMPPDSWAGTPRSLAEGLITALPARMRSAAMRETLARLLLSDIAPPPGPPGGRGFAAIRLEPLARMGDLGNAEAFATAVPAALEDDATALSLFAARWLAGDTDAVCTGAPEQVRRFADPAWQKFLIACQVRAGELAGATIGVDMLREQGELDEDFLLLAESAAAGRTRPVRGVVRPSQPHLALIIASKRSPEPQTRVDEPASLAALAMSPETPIALRLTAAEEAAALGLLAPAALATVYQSVSIADNELRDPLAAAQARAPGPQVRALLVQGLRNATSAGIKAELLRAAVTAGDVPLLTGTYGAILMQELGQVPPSSAYGFLAPSAARVALLQGRADIARLWVDIARAELVGGNADPGAFHRLWPLAALNGLARPSDVDLATWVDAQLEGNSPQIVQRTTAVAGLLAAAGLPLDKDPVDGLLLAAVRTPPAGAATPPDPLLMERLAAAADAGRVAETVLLSAHLLAASSDTLTVSRAVAALRAVGLEAEAGRLATEAAAGLLDP